MADSSLTSESNTPSPTHCLDFVGITWDRNSASVNSWYALKDHMQGRQWTKSSSQHLDQTSQLLGEAGAYNRQSSIFGAELAPSANATANNATSADEISKSLIRFAFWTAYQNNTESSSLSVIDDVMQDFANNGYASDDINSHYYSFNTIGNRSVSRDAYKSSNPYNCTSYYPENFIDWSQLNRQMHPTLQNQFNFCFNNDKMNISRNVMPAKAQPTEQCKQSQNANICRNLLFPATNKSDQNFTHKRQTKRNSNTKNDKHSAAKYCVFCENNNEPEAFVKSHAVRDSTGRVLCPRLRLYICPICKATGDMAHTVKYCPQKPIITMEDSIRSELFRLTKINCYKQQMKV